MNKARTMAARTKATLTAAVTATASLVALAATPAHADTIVFQAEVRLAALPLDLTAPGGGKVVTRDPEPEGQIWQFIQAGTTEEGSVFTVRSTRYGTSCIQDSGPNADVVLAPCDSTNPAQRWIVLTPEQQDSTTIANEASPDEVLQANGIGKAVTVSSIDGPAAANQLWELRYQNQ